MTVDLLETNKNIYVEMDNVISNNVEMNIKQLETEVEVEQFVNVEENQKLKDGEKVVLTNHLKTDVDEAATLMKPQQIKEMIDYSEFNPKVISALLPFLDSEYVEELMNKCKDAGKSIAVFLPFLSEERIDELAEEANTNGESFMMFLPFMSEENLRKLAYEAFDRGGLKEASPFFPFMQDKDLNNLAEKLITLD